MNRWMILLLAWFVAVNLRTVFVSVSPVLPLIQKDLGLTFAESGLLFSIPTLMMGLFALPSGWMMERFGNKSFVSIALLFLLVGSMFRFYADGYLSLLVFTCLFSVGIGMAQPALIDLVKEWFPDRSGTATGIYSSGYMIGSTIAAALTGTVLLSWMGHASWRGTFLFWSVPVGFALLAWMIVARNKENDQKTIEASDSIHSNKLSSVKLNWKNRTILLTIALFSTQSALFYMLITWLPAYYYDYLQWDLDKASIPLGIFSFIMIPSSLILPYLSDRIGARRPFFIVSGFVFLVGLMGLIQIPETLPWLWSILMGVPLTVFFVIGLALPIDLGKGKEVGIISGWMLSVGYAGSLLGSFAGGYLRDLTSTFTATLWWGMALGVAQLWISLALPETYRNRTPRDQTNANA
jgi:CP family cyanate transporter-like MFS transporter